MTKKEIIGYTAGVFDLFHVGHVNLLKFAKSHCDKLIVGLVSDEESLQRKGKIPVYPYEQRKQILESCRYVDGVYPHKACEDLAICNEIGATVQFVGSDWKGTDLYNKMEQEYAAQGKRILYTNYTQGISSTQVRTKLNESQKTK